MQIDLCLRCISDSRRRRATLHRASRFKMLAVANPWANLDFVNRDCLVLLTLPATLLPNSRRLTYYTY